MRKGDWIQTYSGIAFYPYDIREGDIYILDIAHALSMICRFNGHCNRFYSVAEHCWHTSHLVPREHAFAALLHDASEAYMSDLARPIKKMLTDYTDVEKIIEAAIAKYYNITFPYVDEIYKADYQMLADEKAVLMGTEPQPWGAMPEPIGVKFNFWSPGEAQKNFLKRFSETLKFKE